MRHNQEYTPDQIQQLYTDGKPRFVALLTPNGETEIPYNPPNKKSEERIKEIISRLKNKTTPPGVYLYCTKTASINNSVQNEYPVRVGKPVNDTKIQTIQMQAESVWSTAKAIEIMTEKNRLEMLLDFEKEQNRQLRERIIELEKELDAVPLNEGNTPNGWLKDASESLKPILDLYFEQNERRLTLEEKKLGMNGSSKKQNTTSGRPDGGILPTDNRYKEYFEEILNSGSEDDLNYECDYLEANFPDIYPAIMQLYKIEEIPDNETNGE